VRPGCWVERWEKMHRKALKQAARVIVLGDDMRERILAKGARPENVVVVRDGAPPAGAAVDLSDPKARQAVAEIRGDFSFVVVHAGNLGFYGAWDSLLEAAKILRNENIGFVFVGDGASRASLESRAAGSPNVRFLPFRPFNEVPYVMAAGDVHVITVKRGLEGVVVPSKLYGILAAGRPVLVVAPPECDAARIVVESGCGVTADPDDRIAIANAIRGLRDDPPTPLVEMGIAARKVSGQYTRLSELQRFVAIVEETASHRNGGRHLEK
jgi:colanic acid biosynthesis glycosyl transferase WcaI